MDRVFSVTICNFNSYTICFILKHRDLFNFLSCSIRTCLLFFSCGIEEELIFNTFCYQLISLVVFEYTLRAIIIQHADKDCWEQSKHTIQYNTIQYNTIQCNTIQYLYFLHCWRFIVYVQDMVYKQK